MWTRTVTYSDETGSRTYMDGWVSEEHINRQLMNHPERHATKVHYRGYIIYIEGPDSGPLFRGWNSYVYPKDLAFMFPTFERAMSRLEDDIRTGLGIDITKAQIWTVDCVPMESMTYVRLEYETEEVK